jgi:ABC-2 type transport system ATP-binding protein
LTVIFSTHLMDNAERLCDAVCIIARGEVVLDGPLGEVKARHGGRHVALSIESNNGAVSRILDDASLVRRVDDSNRYLEVELADGADPQELLRRVVSTGAMVQRFELIQPSLHQIFLDKVGASGVEDGITGHG